MVEASYKILTFVNLAFFAVNIALYIRLLESYKMLEMLDRHIRDVVHATKSIKEVIENQGDSIITLFKAVREHCENDSLHK